MDNTIKTVAKIGQDIAAASQSAVTSYSEKTISGARDLADFNKGTLAAFTEASQIFVTGAQDLFRDATQSSQAAFAEALAGMRELASVKSPKDGLELQASLMRASFNRLVSESNRLILASKELTEKATAPITAGASLAAEKFAAYAA